MGRPLRIEYDGAWYHVMNRNKYGVKAWLRTNGFVLNVLSQALTPWPYYFGSLLHETYGNGVTRNYDYYTNSHRLQTMSMARDSETYAQKTYEYDIYSNITLLNDNLNKRGTGGLSNVVYDPLSRLTDYTRQDNGVTRSLTYDAQGNILTNTAEFGADAYEYNSSKPHAVTNIGSLTFTYDDNGNMLTDGDRTMTYNAQNQLVQVVMKNGNIIEYDYDYTGTRVSKSVSREDTYHHLIQNTVHYLGDAVEIKDDKIILNIFANKQKVATRCLGTIDELMGGAAASTKPIGITPNVRITTIVPYLLLGFALFLMLAFRPVSRRLPAWAFKLHNPLAISRSSPLAPGGRGPAMRRAFRLGRGGPLTPLQRAKRALIYLFSRATRNEKRATKLVLRTMLYALRLYRSLASAFQEAIFTLPQNFATKAITFVLMLSFSVCLPILQAKAGDTGTPATSQSDATYFYYVHGDHLGSSHVITEGNRDGGKHAGLKFNRGDLIQRIEYSPFGQEKFVLNPNIKYDPEFTGQKYDMESGLYYYKARYYNPKIGRFTQADTVVPSVADYQSFNRYAYVRNNPLKYVDPSGHSFWSWFKKIVATIIGVLIAALITALSAGAMTTATSSALAVAFFSGAAGGAAGGLIGGFIQGGLKGALMGFAFGILGGLFAAGGHVLTEVLKSEIAAMAIMGSVGAGMSYATGGWKGLLMFGVGLIGAFVGGRIADSILKSSSSQSDINGTTKSSKVGNSANIDKHIENVRINSGRIPDGDGVMRRIDAINAKGGISFGDIDAQAMYNPSTDTITLSNKLTEMEIPGRLAHEGTHALWHSQGKPYTLANEMAAKIAGYNLDTFFYPSRAIYPTKAYLQSISSYKNLVDDLPPGTP